MVLVGASLADTAPRVLVSPSVMALPAPSPGMPSGTVPTVVLLGEKVESPESAWSEGAQAATPKAMIVMGRNFCTSLSCSGTAATGHGRGCSREQALDNSGLEILLRSAVSF